MLTLTLRTDKPEAEVGLFIGHDQKAYYSWQADRQLAETIHLKIKDLLTEDNVSLKDINSIAIYKGPGSFTGLRIGFSVANALATGLDVPIVTTTGDKWIDEALLRLESNEGSKQVLPEYGSPPHITKPKH
jgi:tRNA threonylcarbamoyladenosine biosynthesis protein TsaB